MRALTALALIGLLAACEGDVTDDTNVDTDPDTDSETDTEVDLSTIDNDKDGHYADVDCNDADYSIYPGAVEVCDGIDQDCDDLIDEDFDADEDGYIDAIDCTGDDCDDSDPNTYPGADEVPYDGIDQDCDGEDLRDVDEDGHIAVEASGQDCDDNDPTIYPGADEVEKDGIDQDCDGADDIDGDNDGYGDIDFGGDDCDDTLSTVHPGAWDWMNDSVDSDCNSRDSDDIELVDATTSVVGNNGIQDLLGSSVALCDIDGDSQLDLLVAAAFYGGAGTYTGAIGVFYGANSALWEAEMTMSDADVSIIGDDQFFAHRMACGDIDGDGYDDLVTNRMDIQFSVYNETHALYIFYGDGTTWSASMDEGDADAAITYDIAAGTNYTSPTLRLGDTDDDGAMEIILVTDELFTDSGQDEIVILPSGSYSGSYDISEVSTITLFDDDDSSTGSVDSITAVHVIEDFNGDGDPDLFVGQGTWSSDYSAFVADDLTSTYPEPMEGRAGFTPIPTDGDDLSSIAYADIVGTTSRNLFGYDAVFDDLDGDGSTDMLVSGPWEGDVWSDGGAIYFVSDVGSELSSTGLDAETVAGSMINGGTGDTKLGWSLAAAGDVDGDGSSDVWVRENANDGLNETVWLLSGANLTGDPDADDCALAAFKTESADADLGSFMLVGDLDGDGTDDFVFSAQSFLTTPSGGGSGVATGKVYIYLSSEWGF